MNFYQRALELQTETIAHRRYFHTNAEPGLNTPKACAYITKTLTEYGLNPIACGHGVTATLGSGKPCLLLRADMDALPMPEESGEPFACPTGSEAHTCGHDMHAAMLLTAAKLLKEREDQLKGTVKFMFQPAEETFEGAQDMIDHGILKNPAVDAAMALHVGSGQMPLGLYMYNSTGTMMASVDGFRITLRGKGAHGAYPQNSIDPINMAVHVYLALEALIAREADPSKMCVLTVGRFNAGTAPNIIPEEAVLEGTLRTNDKENRNLLVRRIREVAEGTATVYGGSAQLEVLSAVPPLVCDRALTEEMVGYIPNLGIPNAMPYPGISTSASEDFAVIADKVPSVFMHISAGFPDERGQYPAHNPKVRFNEDCLPMGAAIYAGCAENWLKQHG